MKSKPVVGGTDGEDIHYQAMSRSKLGVCVSSHTPKVPIWNRSIQNQRLQCSFLFIFFKQSIVCGYLSMEVPVKTGSKTDT